MNVEGLLMSAETSITKPAELLAKLEPLMPAAITWARELSLVAIEEGHRLEPAMIAVAKAVGVQRPDLVRVLTVDNLPLPDDETLRNAALSLGLLGPDMNGLTVGYGIFICRGRESKRLLSHELRHVHQYERAGFIGTFIPEYVRQLVTYGYHVAPFELDARFHEISEE